MEAILERQSCRLVTGEGRPVQVRMVYHRLVRDYGYAGSYRGVVRHLRRRYGVPPARAYRRVETPPGVQAQHDWFEARTRIQGERAVVQRSKAATRNQDTLLAPVSGSSSREEYAQ